MLDIIGTCHWLCSVMRDSLRPCDSSPRGFSVHGILQARILERVAISFSREPSRPRDPAHDSCVSFIGSGFFTTEPGKHLSLEDKTNFLKPPGGASGKVSACQCRDLRDAERGRSPGGGNGSPLQYSCLGNPILCPWGPKESSQLSTHTHLRSQAQEGSSHSRVPHTCLAIGM